MYFLPVVGCQFRKRDTRRTQKPNETLENNVSHLKMCYPLSTMEVLYQLAADRL